MKGDETTFKLSQVMRKRLTITGSLLRPRDIAFKSSVAAKLKEFVWPWLESGKIKPVVFETFPLEKAAEAHRLMESSKHIGKIVLTTTFALTFGFFYGLNSAWLRGRNFLWVGVC